LNERYDRLGNYLSELQRQEDEVTITPEIHLEGDPQ
jgi:hypothetical protein